MLCVFVCVRVCVLKVYIHSCLCLVDSFITLMKHSYTGCQMCSPVSVGLMSPCPRLRFFHQKRKWKRTLLAWGREGFGRRLEEVREKRERERENRRMFTSGFALWALSLDKKWGGDHFGFIGRRRRRQAGRWQQAERVKKEMLTVSYETNSYGISCAVIIDINISMTSFYAFRFFCKCDSTDTASCVFCEEDLITRKKHQADFKFTKHHNNIFQFIEGLGNILQLQVLVSYKHTFNLWWRHSKWPK